MHESTAANLKLWEWLERHRAETTREAEEAALQIPALATAMASMTEEARAAQQERSRELQRQALAEGNWGPWVDDLIAQGRAFAQMGVEFEDWYRLLGLLRKPLLDRLPDDPADRRVLFGAWTAYVETAGWTFPGTTGTAVALLMEMVGMTRMGVTFPPPADTPSWGTRRSYGSPSGSKNGGPPAGQFQSPA